VATGLSGPGRRSAWCVGVARWLTPCLRQKWPVPCPGRGRPWAPAARRATLRAKRRRGRRWPWPGSAGSSRPPARSGFPVGQATGRTTGTGPDRGPGRTTRVRRRVCDELYDVARSHRLRACWTGLASAATFPRRHCHCPTSPRSLKSSMREAGQLGAGGMAPGQKASAGHRGHTDEPAGSGTAAGHRPPRRSRRGQAAGSRPSR
jgi:hypothetical protein